MMVPKVYVFIAIQRIYSILYQLSLYKKSHGIHEQDNIDMIHVSVLGPTCPWLNRSPTANFFSGLSRPQSALEVKG